MRARILYASTVLVFVICGIALTQQVRAMTFSSDDRYTLPVSDTIQDDLYVTCGGAQMTFGSEGGGPGGGFIDGTVLGDVCLAGGAYHFTGEVAGNLNSASQRATLRGHIQKSARVAAQWVTIDGEIGKDALIFASEVELSNTSVINRDLSVMGGEISINGTVGRNAYIFGDQIIISGTIGGDVEIEAKSLTIIGPSEIQGNIKYKSPRKLKIDDDVIVHGDIDWEKIEKTKEEDDGSDIGFDIVLFFCSLATGLIIIPLFRQHTTHAVNQILASPLPSLGTGFVFLCAAPFAIVLLMITIIGIPASLMLLFAYTVFFYIAKIYTSIALGELIYKAFRKTGQVRTGISFIIGLIILSLLFNAPYIGWIVYFLTIFFGLGGLLRGLYQCRQQITSAESPPQETENMT